ncbi:MAG: hypothetical protein WAQ98_00925 [Blastocatellia bacterium]
MNNNQQKPNDKKPLLVKKANTANTSTINSSSSTKVNTANNQLSAPAKAPVKESPTLANTQATTQAKPVTKTTNAPKPTTSTTPTTLVKGATPAKVVAKTPPPITKTPSQQPSSQPLSKTSPQPKQPAQVVKAVKAVSIAPVTIERAITDETLTKAQMDITVKISELPSEVNTNEQGVKQFYVKANEREVFIAISSKQYNKLVTAQQTWPSWIGRIAGKLGQATKDGFILDQANVQVFEKIVKTPTADNAKNQPSAKPNNNVNDNKTTGYKNNLPVTNEQYKEICKQFNPYLSKGKLPSQEEINKILAPYQLNKETQTKLLGYLLYNQRVERQKGFLIETLYFKLLPAWDKSYSDLIKNIAKQLDIHEKLVDTWLSFIQKMPSYLDKVKLPTEDLAKEIIKIYEKYLLSETPPELGLHSWIAQSIASSLTKDQIHKVLASYRRQSRKELYDRYFAKKAEERQKLKEAQLLLDAATVNNDKANNNETSDNKS